VSMIHFIFILCVSPDSYFRLIRKISPEVESVSYSPQLGPWLVHE